MDTASLGRSRYLSITTFKRDGTPVSTPVWVAAEDGTLLVHSEARSWKVKRIRRDGHVRVAPCTATGTIRGDALDADATIDDDTETVSKLLARKYGVTFRVVEAVTALMRKLRRRPTPRGVTIRIVPRMQGR
jgi:PPOX class probable F420-dependent enzyme